MSYTSTILSLIQQHPIYTLFVSFLSFLFIPYLLDQHHLLTIPGPFLAKFSDLWLTYISVQGHRSETVHSLHEKYGPVVRIAPNHVSIATPDALQTIYAHGNGALKSNFYDAFVSIQRGLFNTRDRNEHSRKRKLVSHIFSQKSVLEFEPHIRMYVGQLLEEWEKIFEAGLKGGKGEEGEGWVGRDGRVWMDVLPWCNYLAFDIIGDLAFGAPFGMIKAGKDTAPIPASGPSADLTDSKNQVQVTHIPAVKILNGRGEYSMSMGCLPPSYRPYFKRIPWFAAGAADVKSLAGIAIMAVRRRLQAQASGSLAIRNTDLLEKLQNGKDDNGNPMGRDELTAEALTLLIAGSDTTSNSTCAILYFLAKTPRAQKALHEELDRAVPDPTNGEGLPVTVEDVKADKLPYLDACINEGLRIHSTSALGLPRIVPEGGMTVEGISFVEGTVLSVPSYTIHRDTEVWGEDAEEFRPERWLDLDSEKRDLVNKTFNPFSVGPRACVGRNLAFLELQIIVASLVRRWEFVLEDGVEQELKTSEGFLRKPLGCRVGIRRRD
ncbi:cytochrome P450 monooxygenase pc-bph [Gymnopus androsaceus JB14]|uniref:Cytochrome P450 monooxygenase pc-bph n=1 Tax=Gymnopus androsaceus JB14 TaxID=1447944 RepID=A0A6A4HYW9_9AGAR|nr:cytochrome P450 monooxygenase pc-bph [Gymnopus androsaceus JB14]